MNPDQYKVVIPSYQRAGTLAKKTIDMLGRHGIDPACISVVVADDQQAAEYKVALPQGSYSEILVGVPGMGAVRNWIQQYFADDDLLWCVDDDIAELFERVDEKTKRPVEDLHGFVVGAFKKCLETGFKLWGIYPVLNPFFMSDKTTTDLRYIIGCCWGCVNRRDLAFSVTLDDKEDFERTIKYYLADNGVLRFSSVAPATNYYGEPGGMQVERTEGRVTKSANLLVERYPDLCTLNLTKKSGHAEIRLKDIRIKGSVFF